MAVELELTCDCKYDFYSVKNHTSWLFWLPVETAVFFGNTSFCTLICMFCNDVVDSRDVFSVIPGNTIKKKTSLTASFFLTKYNFLWLQYVLTFSYKIHFIEFRSITWYYRQSSWFLCIFLDCKHEHFGTWVVTCLQTPDSSWLKIFQISPEPTVGSGLWGSGRFGPISLAPHASHYLRFWLRGQLAAPFSPPLLPSPSMPEIMQEIIYKT